MSVLVSQAPKAGSGWHRSMGATRLAFLRRSTCHVSPLRVVCLRAKESKSPSNSVLQEKEIIFVHLRYILWWLLWLIWCFGVEVDCVPILYSNTCKTCAVEGHFASFISCPTSVRSYIRGCVSIRRQRWLKFVLLHKLQSAGTMIFLLFSFLYFYWLKVYWLSNLWRFFSIT